MDDGGVYTVWDLGCYSSFILFKRLNWGVAIADYTLYNNIYDVCECCISSLNFSRPRHIFLVPDRDIFFTRASCWIFVPAKEKNIISSLYRYYIYTYKSIHRFRVGLSRCYSLVTVLFFSDVCEIITWREK